ncbi:hypothetical protein SAMN05421688_0727 [Poseidonocella pacifica]|uniref:Glycosyl transferase family 2 n=1 Tax=Poseidonocella pacifica TaxID=871651 RepID=A0A1I0VLE9_9RHOB|nr:hypothetical protein [Poseidonocella pacifica]SFA76847.1 hypothetical protein SAMN05421688_0727 [Poseidonocella pacifica]
MTKTQRPLKRRVKDTRKRVSMNLKRIKGKAWAAFNPPATPSPAPEVLFAIPLVSRRRAPDWDRVEANLTQTLHAIQAQTDGRWRAVICGQDRPEGIPQDERITFITSTVSDRFYDKGYKRRQLIDHFAATTSGDGYYVQHDADDLLHPETVAYILRDNNGHGYFVEQGYCVQVSSGRIGKMDNFYIHCGTSSAVYVDFRRNKRHAALLKPLTSHSTVIAVCGFYGRILQAIPFRAACYMIDHGQNMFERRGKMQNKINVVDRNEITDPAKLAEIQKTFNL